MKFGMRFFIYILTLMIILNCSVYGKFEPASVPRSYYLMDWDTGTVMAEYKADEPYPIASVTKVMSMIIYMEAIQSGKITFDDVVTASEYACSMGGSQIYLEPGEQMKVSDLLKSVAVSSANDACVALAEYIMGSADAFVEVMNQKAKDLGMANTHFVNCNGLDEDNHYSTARDVAIMSRELLKYNDILPYLSIWMDSVRDGAFGLSNTNKLIRYYDGAIGVKTGSTSNAKYCLSAAAARDGLTLIAVVLGAETTSDRFETAKELLNYGFANYKIEKIVNKNENIGTINIKKGVSEKANIIAESDFKKLKDKQNGSKIETKTVVDANVYAPVTKGQKVGKIEILENGKNIGEVNLVSADDVDRISLTEVFLY